jgi:hypothetical protein
MVPAIPRRPCDPGAGLLQRRNRADTTVKSVIGGRHGPEYAAVEVSKRCRRRLVEPEAERAGAIVRGLRQIVDLSERCVAGRASRSRAGPSAHPLLCLRGSEAQVLRTLRYETRGTEHPDCMTGRTG